MPIKDCRRLNYNNILITSGIAVACVIIFTCLFAFAIDYMLSANYYSLKVASIGAFSILLSFAAITIIKRTKYTVSCSYKKSFAYYEKLHAPSK